LCGAIVRGIAFHDIGNLERADVGFALQRPTQIAVVKYSDDPLGWAEDRGHAHAFPGYLGSMSEKESVSHRPERRCTVRMTSET